MKITVVGAGYVGMANATLLAQKNDVVLLDIDKDRVDLINDKKSPIIDDEIKYFLEEKNLSLYATTDSLFAYQNANFVIVATPTDYNSELNEFDTSSIESVISEVLDINPEASIVIKSTIPIGYVRKIREKFKCDNIFFSPEFLREGNALFDNLFPSRIVVGDDSVKAKIFASLLKDAAMKSEIPIFFVGMEEAESIKLFANTYLAMRVAFFNELDSFALENGFDSRQIIDGVCFDKRIGNHYNNPSFGYGGYCLPKDTKQLLANYKYIEQDLIGAIVESNNSRKFFLVREILRRKPQTVGLYKLAMKSGSDNFRESSIFDIAKKLSSCGIKILVYDDSIAQNKVDGHGVVKEFNKFVSDCDVVLANRYDKRLDCVKEKVFTRDVFGRD